MSILFFARSLSPSFSFSQFATVQCDATGALVHLYSLPLPLNKRMVRYKLEFTVNAGTMFGGWISLNYTITLQTREFAVCWGWTMKSITVDGHIMFCNDMGIINGIKLWKRNQQFLFGKCKERANYLFALKICLVMRSTLVLDWDMGMILGIVMRRR